MDKNTLYNQRWIQKTAVVFLATFLFFPAATKASTIFAGVGNDGYYRDVQGIYSALQNVSGGMGISNQFMRENLTGSEIGEFITGLQPVLQPNDTLIWYYSGHGGWLADSNGDESAPNSFAEDTFDETVGLLNGGDQLTDDDMSQAFSSLSATGSTIITIFDTCYAGGFIGGTDDLNRVDGLTFFGSSTELEQSYGFDDQPYSIFTQGLINGLGNFNGDFNGDGILLAEEWFDFAQEYTIGSVNEQHPVFWGDEDLFISSQTAVPLPGSVFFLGSALACLIAVRQNKFL